MTAPNTIVVDTDVFSYLFSKSEMSEVFLPHLVGRIPALTFVTVGELFAGAYGRNWGERKLMEMED